MKCKSNLLKACILLCFVMIFVITTNPVNIQAMEHVEVKETDNREPYYYSSSICVLDVNGQKVESVIVHEGESLFLQLGELKSNGTYSPVESTFVGGAEWALGLSYKEDDMQKCYESTYAKVWAPYAFKPNQVYIKGLSATSDSDNYYLTYYIYPNIFDEIYVSIPITVLPAESGVTYPTYGQEKPCDIFETLDEGYGFIRDIMRNRECVEVEFGMPVEEGYQGFEGAFGFYTDQLELPNYAGDYMDYNGSGFLSTHKGYDTVYYHGVDYYAYEVDTSGWKYRTTVEQETWFDAKLAEMFGPGGVLEYCKNLSDYDKVVACMEYIRDNVSYVSSYESVYHSAWSALYNKKATCEGYSLLLYRMLRELGIGNRILMGTDYAAHTYNIVLLDGKYYYCDPTAFIVLKGENSFEHSTLQSKYLVEEFQRAILSRISLEDYDKGEEGEDGYTGIKQATDGNWYYYVDGEINTNYTGLYCDAVCGWWLVQNGVVNFNYTGLYYDTTYGWWLVQGGTINFGYTGLYGDATYGWWLVQGGTINFGYTGLYGDATYGWWLVQGGTINFGYTGLYGDATYGWWLVQGGTVDFGYTGLYCDAVCGWWLVQGGTVSFGYTGIYGDLNYGWWYVEGGAINFGFTGLAVNEYGWWYVENGTINFGYTGQIVYDGVTYNIVNGAVV